MFVVTLARLQMFVSFIQKLPVLSGLMQYVCLIVVFDLKVRRFPVACRSASETKFCSGESKDTKSSYD